jgi:hypothetical protein
MGNRVDPYDLGDLLLLMMTNTRLLIRTSNSSLIETALPLCQYIGTLAVPASGQERWAAPLLMRKYFSPHFYLPYLPVFLHFYRDSCILTCRFALLSFCHLLTSTPLFAMETHYLAALAGTLHIAFLWMVTTKALNTTLIQWYIWWIPCAIGTIFYLAVITFLGLVLIRATAPIWLLLFLLELAHCSEVDALSFAQTEGN